MNPQTVFFIGKPGCGKGTQAKLLSERTGWQVLGSGKQFRKIAEQSTPVGRKTKHDIDRGLLMPHWFAMYLYLDGLFSIPENESVIFDGFNRKEAEADLVISSLQWLERPFTVIEIAVSDEEIRRRLMRRKSIENRADDNTVETRLEEYEMYTTKALTMFREQGVLVTVDGERSPEEIAENVAHVLNLA